jgi:uncharacterized membrane protein
LESKRDATEIENKTTLGWTYVNNNDNKNLVGSDICVVSATVVVVVVVVVVKVTAVHKHKTMKTTNSVETNFHVFVAAERDADKTLS